MAIRIRTVNDVRVALCAAETESLRTRRKVLARLVGRDERHRLSTRVGSDGYAGKKDRGKVTKLRFSSDVAVSIRLAHAIPHPNPNIMTSPNLVTADRLALVERLREMAADADAHNATAARDVLLETADQLEQEVKAADG
jgi:hypothetical protein